MAGSGSGSLIDLPGTPPVGLVEKGAEISGLLLGPGTPYIIRSWDGFGTPEVRVTDEAREGEDGDFLGVDTLASRTMVLEITVRGDTPAQVEQYFKDFLNAWQLSSGSNYTNLWFLLPGGEPLRAIGRPRRASANRSMMLSGRIDIVAEFYSPFSALFGPNSVNPPTTPLIQTGSGRTYPFTYPKYYSSSYSGGEVAYVDNDGSYPSWAVFEFTAGDVTTPRMTVDETGEFIAFDISLTDTDVLIVDMRLRTAKKNGVSVRHTLLPGSTWFFFAPGETLTLRYNPDVSDTTAQCEVTYAPAHRG